VSDWTFRCPGSGATAGMADERHEQMAGRTGRQVGIAVPF
jgi:hypothetical protein